jgi:hypothetical protein
MQVTHVATVATLVLMYFFTSGHIQEATRYTAMSTMDMSLALILVAESYRVGARLNQKGRQCGGC